MMENAHLKSSSSNMYSIPMSHVNVGYIYDDSVIQDDHHSYIDPSEWTNQASNSQYQAETSFGHQKSALKKRTNNNPSNMLELIGEMPSHTIKGHQRDGACDNGSFAAGPSCNRQESKHTGNFTSKTVLWEGDLNEEQMYNKITKNPNATELEMKDTLREMTQNLTMKRSVKARLSQVLDKRKDRQVSCLKGLKYGIEMTCQNSKYRLKELFHSLDLWHQHLKSIQGHFGSGVASYFFFLRWLFYLNFLGFLILMCFIVVPQLIFKEDNPDGNDDDDTKKFTGWEIITGTGIFEKSLLYYGAYTNETISIYSMPEAYLFGNSAYIVLCVLLLSYSLARSYKHNYIVNSGELNNVFANKVFSAWDYSIEREEAARLKSSSIFIELRELISSEMRDEEERSLGERLYIYFWRFFINVLVLGILCATGYLVFFLLESKYVDKVDIPVLAEMTFALVVTAIVFVVPTIFLAMSTWEGYTSKQTILLLNMIRIALLRLLILAVIVYFWLYQNRIEMNNKKVCWETELGQEVYRLIIVDFLCVLLFSTLIMEFVRRLAFKYCLSFVGNPEFDIAQNTLDLIYTQTLTWVGFFYCPLLPLITLLKLVIIFYTKRVSVVQNCRPSLKPWRASHAQTIFLSLTFASLLLTLVSIGYSILVIKPSEICGPFRHMKTRYDIVVNVLFYTSNDQASFVKYLFSPGVVAGFLLFLSVMVYYTRAKAKAHQEMVELLKDQLRLEGKDKDFLLRLFESAMQQKNKDYINKTNSQQQISTSLNF